MASETSLSVVLGGGGDGGDESVSSHCGLHRDLWGSLVVGDPWCS